MKVVEEELLDNRMEESGIFLIWAGRPIMMNSVLEGLRQSRLDDISIMQFYGIMQFCSSKIGDRTKWYWTKCYGQMVAICINSNSAVHHFKTLEFRRQHVFSIKK